MKRGLLISYLVGGLLLVLGLIYDKEISLFITSLRVEILSNLMVWVSYFGSGFFILIFMTSLFLWQEKKREYIVPLWASVIISLIVVYIIKIIFLRLRPFEVLGIIPLVKTLTSSFPSGHTAAAFSTIAILDKEFPKFKWFWIAFSVLIGFSRIYVGVHYLSDVVFAAILGGSIGIYMCKKKEWFNFNLKNKKEK